MNKVWVECESITCLHHDKTTMTCGITEDSFININKKGECLDYTPLTKGEMLRLKRRKLMNPNLNRSEAYLRVGKRMYTPVHPQYEVPPSDDNPEGVPHPHAGKRLLEQEYDSINSAKRRSRELMKSGKVIVTKE